MERKLVDLVQETKEDNKERVNELLTKYLEIHTFFDTTARVKFHEFILKYFLTDNNLKSIEKNNITSFIDMLKDINFKDYNTASKSLFLTAEVNTSIIEKNNGKTDSEQIYWEYLNKNPLPVFIKINIKRDSGEVFKNVELRVYKDYINKMIIDRLTPNLMMYQEGFEIEDWKTIYENILKDEKDEENIIDPKKN